jgi:hypothetical protein
MEIIQEEKQKKKEAYYILPQLGTRNMGAVHLFHKKLDFPEGEAGEPSLGLQFF